MWFFGTETSGPCGCACSTTSERQEHVSEYLGFGPIPGILWHSSRKRWVLGIEKLALQGIFAEVLGIPLPFQGSTF